MKIVIDGHKAISWNKLYSQKHWSERSQLAKYVHQLVRYVGLDNQKHLFKKKVDIGITAYYKDKKLRDSDNICAKLYIDGLKGFVIKDDDTRFVGKVSMEARIGCKENKVEIIVR